MLPAPAIVVLAGRFTAVDDHGGGRRGCGDRRALVIAGEGAACGQQRARGHQAGGGQGLLAVREQALVGVVATAAVLTASTVGTEGQAIVVCPPCL